MSAFDKVVGYDAIKNSFLQVIDMIKNPEYYEKFNVRIPHGILLDGEPGLGKSLLCKCFIEEAGIPTYTVRRDAGDEDFINKITQAFEDAKNNAPSIVFLDDLDKFANGDEQHKDCPEYVAVQSGIDSCVDSIVLALATTNDIDTLPDSLYRAGRFDRTIIVPYPSREDAEKILKHYMVDKNVDPDINIMDVVNMTGENACCVLETVINEAGINAGYERSEYVTINHILNAVLKQTYHCPDDTTITSDEEIEKIAIHEASHCVISECLVDESIGLVSVKNSRRNSVGGFVHRCKTLDRRPYHVLISLAGKVGTELYYPRVASGCNSDLYKAISTIHDGMTDNALMGYSLIDAPFKNPASLSEAQSAVEHAELERYSVLARNILLANREFLEKIRNALVEKETLLFSDVQAIKATCKITRFEV